MKKLSETKVSRKSIMHLRNLSPSSSFFTVQEAILATLCLFVADMDVPDFRIVNKSICTPAENVIFTNYDIFIHPPDSKVAGCKFDADEIISIAKFRKGFICKVPLAMDMIASVFYFVTKLKYLVHCSIFILKTCVRVRVVYPACIPAKNPALRMVRFCAR